MRDAWIRQESSDLEKDSGSCRKVRELEDVVSQQRGRECVSDVLEQIKILNEANSRLQNQLKDTRAKEQRLIEENQIVHDDYIKAKMALQDAEKLNQQKMNRSRQQQSSQKDETISSLRT